MPKAKRPPRIDTFGLTPGRKIGPLYRVVQLLGRGQEGEVYQIQEIETGIQRAAKLYFPHRDPKSNAIVWHARKLNALRHCPIVLQYHHTELIQVARRKVRCLISEFYEGAPLEQWIADHRGGRLTPFMALHVLYHLVRGLEGVHALGEYHADVHSGNILIHAMGVGFELKLVDFYNWGRPTRAKQKQDVIDTITVFHESLGGSDRYARLPPEIRKICGGLQHKRILDRFPTMSALRGHLESFAWETKI